MRFEGKADLLHLAVLLSGTQEGIAIADLEREFKVSGRTAQRMMAAIKERFTYDIVEADTDGPAKRWKMRSGTLQGLIEADRDELVEVEIAAERLRTEGAVPGRAEALMRLLAKLRTKMKPADLRRTGPDLEAMMQAEGTCVRPGPRPAMPLTLLLGVRYAILAGKRMRLLYGATPADVRERVVEPLGILHGQRAYLVAQIVGTGHEPTMFRLDRVVEHDLLKESFVRAVPFDLAAYAAQSFGMWREPPIDVCLRFSGAAALDAKVFHFHPSQTMQPGADGTLLVRFTAGGMLEMCHHLLTWGDTVEVLGPPELRTRLAQMARTAADHHAREPEVLA